MKKKAIEKIPYLKLPKVSKKKNVEYIGVTAVKIIDHKKHLFLEVYENSQETKDVPIVRIVIAKNDFENYYPESGAWDRKLIATASGYRDRAVWSVMEEVLPETSILAGEKDLERIKAYCQRKLRREERWWGYVRECEEKIARDERNKAEERKRERRQQALDDRIAHTKALPEKLILDRVDKKYFASKHYLYYKKRGSWVQIACSSCGGVTDVRWKDGISYESSFQRWTEEPREGKSGSCPMCGVRGEYKCQGKTKGEHGKTIHIFLGQKYKENGMVLRYIEVTKTWKLGLICTDNNVEMENACEELSGAEIARAYFEPGKKTQIDYHKHSWCTGKDFWDDCNLYGNANITISSAPIMTETYGEMAETMFRYSALQEYAKEAGDVNPIKYLELYERMPQIEMLVKLGLIDVVGRLVENYGYGIMICEHAKSPDRFLMIRKERVKQLIARKGSIRYLKVMQMERRLQQVWTDEQIEHLAETGLEQGSVEQATAYMSLQQLLNRIEKYAGCEYDTGCSSAEQRIRHAAVTYTDYLRMRAGCGYDLNNTVYQQPRDLEQAHTKMILEADKGKMDARLREVEAKYPLIRRNYRSLRNKYFYEDDNYIIRPARSAEEIVMEGRKLHHCVGGDGYLTKHNEGRTYILMLRQKADREAPYITVEIEAGRAYILQWYGEHDRKPEEKTIQQWLNGYVKMLRAEAMTTNQKNQKAAERIKVAAIA